MPAYQRRLRYQRAILWPFAGYDRYGEVVVGTPVEVGVRWEARRRETLDNLGNTVMLEAVAVVDQPIAVGSHMWLGTLEDFYESGSAGPSTEVMEVVTTRYLPDSKGRHYRRTVGLTKYKDNPAG